MSYAQFHDGFYRNPKVQKVPSAARWMWAASIGYAAEHLTDGFIPSHALGVLCPELDAKPRAKLAAALVAAGLWETAEDGWRVHDYLNWNMSKAVILERRAANAARVNKHRNAVGNGEGNARVMRYNAGTSRVTNITPSVPLYPLSSSPEDTSCLSPPAAATVATAPPVSTATGDPFALTPPVEAHAENTRAKARQRPAKAPPPFSVADALSAVAAAAGGRFVAGDATTWTGASKIATAKLVHRFPDLTDWTLVGEWLAAGGGGAGVKGFAWAASNAFPEAVAKARAWRDDGRPALVDARGFPVRPAPPPERDPTDPWAAADAALDAHFAARRRAGGGL